jgi:hypothetical protein
MTIHLRHLQYVACWHDSGAFNISRNLRYLESEAGYIFEHNGDHNFAIFRWFTVCICCTVHSLGTILKAAEARATLYGVELNRLQNVLLDNL